jgi:hypothetical protein
VTIVIAVATVVLLLATELDTLWIILGAAVISLSTSSSGQIQPDRLVPRRLADSSILASEDGLKRTITGTRLSALSPVLAQL